VDIEKTTAGYLSTELTTTAIVHNTAANDSVTEEQISTRHEVQSSRSLTNRTLMFSLVSLSVLVFILMMVYVSIRVSDAANAQLRVRNSRHEDTAPNHYEEIELTGVTHIT
jgi:hypothetical protein